MIPVITKYILLKVTDPRIKCPQFLHTVLFDSIGFLQLGHRAIFPVSRSFLAELFLISSLTSYLHSQSNVGHFPLSGILSDQTKLLRHSGHSIFNMRFLPLFSLFLMASNSIKDDQASGGFSENIAATFWLR